MKFTDPSVFLNENPLDWAEVLAKRSR